MTDGFRWNEPILSHTEAKRQHYVPRTYLRPFATQGSQIRVVDLDQNKEYKTALSNVAVERGYYDLTKEGIDASAEEWLAEIETKAAPVIRRLIASPSSIETLSIEEEFAISRFIVALRFRVPAFRHWENEVRSSIDSWITDSTKRIIANMYGETTGDTIFGELKNVKGEPPQPAAGTVGMLGETQGFAGLVLKAPWRIGCALGPAQFHTSDNPLSSDLRPDSPRRPAGFTMLDYYLALSPQVLLKIERWPDEYKSESQLTPRGLRSSIDFSEREVSVARSIISSQATRYLYG